MHIKLVTTQQDWEQGTSTPFLQSWGYGKFLSSIGREVKRFSIKNTDSDSSRFVQCIENTALGFAKYLYIPHITIDQKSLDELLQYAQEHGYAFVRVEPVEELRIKTYETKSTQNLQPQHTLTLDLTETNEDLLSNMHKKTRYNIRLAEKKGVTVRKEKNTALYWNLHTETTLRQGFVTHSKPYIDSLLALTTTEQFTAYLDEEPLASAIMLRSGNTLTYFFGASTEKHRRVMAPYLLHWHMIQYAKEQGCALYDFWGFAPPAEEGSEDAQSFHTHLWKKNHHLSGVSRFKAGFGGHVRSYPNAINIILNPMKYALYTTYGAFRGKKKVVGHSS